GRTGTAVARSVAWPACVAGPPATQRRPIRLGGQYVAKAPPMMESRGTGPQNRLSSDSPRLSPIMNQWPGGIVIGVVRLHTTPTAAAHGLMYESLSLTKLDLP